MALTSKKIRRALSTPEVRPAIKSRLVVRARGRSWPRSRGPSAFAAHRGPAMNQETMVSPDRKSKRDLVHSARTRWPERGVEHGSVTAPESWGQLLPPQPFRKPFALAHAGASTEPTIG